MSTLTKAGLIEAVCANSSGMSKREATEVVEAFFSIIKDTLSKGETIKIAGFGNFIVRDKNQRVGRNPQTGDEITIAARRVVTFKASDLLKQKLNSDDNAGAAPPPSP